MMVTLVHRRASSIIIIIIIGRGCIWAVLEVLVGEADAGSAVVIFAVVVGEDTGLLTVAAGMVDGEAEEEVVVGEGVWVGFLEGTEVGEGVTFAVVVLEDHEEARRWPLRRSRRRLR